MHPSSLRLLTALLIGLSSQAALAEEVSFSREVLPILSDRCFHCHGPDASHRKAEFRLDLEEEAKGDRGGYHAIVGGDLAKSDLWTRIITEDKSELMPPPKSHRKPLSKSEQDIIRRWIEQGAKWGKHWAFEKPQRPALPETHKDQHPIDAFVRAKLAKEGGKPATPAERHTQIRRLSFDLTGLPPVEEDLKEETSWEKLIDQKLASPHHAERLAMWWLDAARYSDTDGYQQDANRTNWPWRDWVVEAFQSNMPFDQFTIEQFAGDLLPDATPEQILATCFHRNHMTNGEGGRHAEESRIDYVIDRVNTTGTVWLGLTLGCTQCHDHKFDPVSQKDYYQLSAFFNSIDETGQAGSGAKPHLSYQSPHAAHAVKEAEAHLATLRTEYNLAKEAASKRFETWLAKEREDLSPDFKAWHSLHPLDVESNEGTEFQIEKDGTVQCAGPMPRQDDYKVRFTLPEGMDRLAGWKLEVFPHESHKDGKFARSGNGEFILTKVKLIVTRKGQSQVHDVEMRSAVADFQGSNDTYKKVSETLDDDPRKGWTTVGAKTLEPHVAVFELREPVERHPDDEYTLILLHRSTVGNDSIGRFRLSLSDQRGEAVRGLKTAPFEDLAKVAKEDKPDGGLWGRLRGQYLLDDHVYQEVRGRLDAANRQVGEFKRGAGKLNVQVLGDREKARDTHILVRGVWDAKGDKVQPGVVPAVLALPAEESKTRLDLANWIVSSDNPLTARVVVNHLWQMMFGAGLVRTPEDFGLQGEFPTHPELLDWLAVELVENDWDIRHVIKLIATSETYRQSSHITPAMLEDDPDNRLLARAPRYRLPSWMIRDSALQAAGLLHPAIGGPPVKPWQPDGVWREIFMGRFTYQPSVGKAQYRRTLYAFWRRASAPTFLFDSAQRRVCEVGVRRTNTPLHALTLMNDVSMLEASRALAEKGDGLAAMARRVLSRSLAEDELKILEREHQKALAHYQKHPDEAVAFTTIGQQRPPEEKSAPELAALMTIASMILNLDEAITRE